MNEVKITKLPYKVTVSEVLNSRYQPGERPVIWDARMSGIDRIITSQGDTIMLYSNGGQSTPAPGWNLMLTKLQTYSDQEAYSWTLYALPSLN